MIDQLNNQNNTNYNTDTSSSIYSNSNSIQSSTNNSKTTFNDQADNINGSFSLLKINENNVNNNTNNNNNNEDNSLNLSNDSMLSSPSLSTNDDKNFMMSNENDSTTTTTITNTIITNNNLTPENGNFSVSELNRRLNGLANNNSNSSNETSKIPKLNGNNVTGTMTRIPRIPNLKSSNAFPAQPEVVAPTTLSLTSKSRSTAISPSRSTPTVETKNQTTSNLVRPTKIATNRVTRSSSKSSCVNGSDNTNNKLINHVKTNGDSLNSTQQVQHQLPKRGISSCSVNKSVRSLSVSSPNDDSFNESDFNLDGTKTVRYVVRHKPKESQVKIFSEKVKIKNISSKIGSFDKANHVPGGGNVQVIYIFYFYI